jgi:hypothetical protein
MIAENITIATIMTNAGLRAGAAVPVPIGWDAGRGSEGTLFAA